MQTSPPDTFAVPLALDISLVPIWEDVEEIRQTVNCSLDACLEDEDLAEAIAMTSAELLENAVKHGCPSDPRVGYALRAADSGVKVEVTNRWSARDDRKVERLLELVDQAKDPEGAEEAYRTAMMKAYEEGLAFGGVGLLRIAYGGQCLLGCEIDTPNRRLTITASYDNFDGTVDTTSDEAAATDVVSVSQRPTPGAQASSSV